jgi:hypothetical protein
MFAVGVKIHDVIEFTGTSPELSGRIREKSAGPLQTRGK